MREIFHHRDNMRRSGFTWIQVDENFKYRCEGGPSIIWDYGREWRFWISGIGLHRLDGPAKSSGEWYINGKNVTKEIHTFAKENNINLDNLTDVDKVMIALKFS